MYERVSRFERTLPEKARTSWHCQKLVAFCTHVMLRKSVARIESHFITAAWTVRNRFLHHDASTDYLCLRRHGLSGASVP